MIKRSVAIVCVYFYSKLNISRAKMMKKGPWTREEDELLSSYISREGVGRWQLVPKKAGLFCCGKSCRLCWMNYLRPSIKRGHISADEEDLILRLHRLLGNRAYRQQDKKTTGTHVSARKAIPPNSHENMANSIPIKHNNGPGSSESRSYSLDDPDDIFSSFLDSLINEETCDKHMLIAESKYDFKNFNDNGNPMI
ncbi:hypothetical protein QVD17_00986 [Tagetes erecta]|uniref:Uncharacterized protein n=1 Tax=Tagetes erecta TaxID=13708 RepID=A0AAD8P124_TARER|nr:hypothetical protein QVD17_00986 [Tagetes erecta]